MPYFRGSVEFQPTIEAAAERLGIGATAVEKDYWVSEVLRVLAREFGGSFIFKGGTSLSKGYRILERFSDDIDVLVLPGGRGRNATDKLMKEMGQAAAVFVGGTASSVGGSETGRHRAYELSYPTSRRPTTQVRTSVLLEMGVRGGPHPHETVAIAPLLADVLQLAGADIAEFDDLGPFEVTVLHPGRTLLEKLVLVHSISQKLANEGPTAVRPRDGRHFYDIYQLLADRSVLELLNDRGQVQQVLDSVAEVIGEHFPSDQGAELRPAAGFGACPAFDAGSAVSHRLRDVYEAAMPELYFGATPLPSWDAICARVTEASALL